MTRPTAVLLDIDGTLLDSNDAHAEAWMQALAEIGRSVPFEEVRRAIGMGGDHLLPAVAGMSAESPEGKALTERRSAMFKQRFLPDCRPFPRVRELIERMRDDGLKLVVATSASEGELEPLLKQAGIADLIDTATTSDDADASKPSPDIVEAALRRAGCPPREAIMLGDTPYDLEAASRAGVPMVALRCGGWPFDDGRALAVYDHPAHLLADWEVSPFRGSR